MCVRVCGLGTVEGLKERCENSHSCTLVQQSAVSTLVRVKNRPTNEQIVFASTI